MFATAVTIFSYLHYAQLKWVGLRKLIYEVLTRFAIMKMVQV